MKIQAFGILALSILLAALSINTFADSDGGPDTIVQRKVIDIHADGERIYDDGVNEVHFCKISLRDAKRGYVNFQVLVDSTNAEKDNFGVDRSAKLLKPVSASSHLPYPSDQDRPEIPLMYVDRDGIWVAYKNTPDGRILNLTGSEMYVILSR